MTVQTWLGWDTETALIRPGVNAPELACVTYSWSQHIPPAGTLPPREWGADILDAQRGLDYLEACLREPSIGFVGHNVAFDWAVCMQARPSLIPLVFQAYQDNRVTDTMIRQQLLDVAAGCYRGEFKGHRWVKYNYDLGSVARRSIGWNINKEDPYRLRYGEFIHIPLDQWPEGARSYPLDDARSTLGIWHAQEVHADPYLRDQFRQASKYFWLYLARTWGLRTRESGVKVFAQEVQEELANLQAQLTAAGLVRPDGTRDTKAATRMMVAACQAENLKVMFTEGAEKKISAGASYEEATENWTSGVSLSEEACERVSHPAIQLYGKYGVTKAVQSKDIPMLVGGIKYPIHTRYGFAETGRTTSSGPNVQNLRGLQGIRECFVPRDGWVYMQADYPGLELKTLAQVCIWLLGGSRLGEVINSGRDPHLMLASTLARCTYEEADAAYHADKEWRPRKLAKVGNFGFPGGLGYTSFIAYAKGGYDIVLEEEEARNLKRDWLDTWPEMREYFRHIGNLCDTESGEAMQIEHPISGRIRGKVRYTAACNGFFQGLGIDAAAEAGFLISRAMYVDQSSPLYGSRLVNFVHDEFIGETPRGAKASPAVLEMCRLMKEGANRWLPDVPFTEIEPVLMSYWSKKAKTVLDAQGNVQVWEG